MVYSQALVFGHSLSAVPEEEDHLTERLKKFFRLDKEHSGVRSGLRKAASFSSLSSDCSWEEDEEDMAGVKRDLTARIEQCLVSAKAESLRCCKLLVPVGMMARVSRDLLRTSGAEPCGLRGAVIHLLLEGQSGTRRLGTVVMEKSLTPTFELSVLLREEREAWPPLRHLLRTDGAVRLRPDYTLVKRKLYSSASPTIIHYC
ncbi:DNA damage-inducible transcript 4-like protein-like [Hoplias malabaricus]|uniref:DNA damage-inducible transcript 4-like protein-like n=1 Tax=Hoplias malabaricus TaxID=27720 RepID=UPI003461F2E0